MMKISNKLRRLLGLAGKAFILASWRENCKFSAERGKMKIFNLSGSKIIKENTHWKWYGNQAPQ
jgi:hypothetical protein